MKTLILMSALLLGGCADKNYGPPWARVDCVDASGQHIRSDVGLGWYMPSRSETWRGSLHTLAVDELSFAPPNGYSCHLEPVP